MIANHIGCWAKRIQNRLQRLSGARLYLFQSPRHGVDELVDFGRVVGDPQVIVDVGANVGQSAFRFRAAFPKARIFSLEPVSTTFAELDGRTAGLGIECRRLALGPEAGTATLYLTRRSLTNSLMRPVEEEASGTEEVAVDTLDGFLAREGIERVDYLKVDAEGFDLDVLRSGRAVFAAGRIRFVQVEVGFHPGDTRHPLVDAVRDELIGFGFRVFGVYGQRLEWTGEPSLRFADAVFCRDDRPGRGKA